VRSNADISRAARPAGAGRVVAVLLVILLCGLCAEAKKTPPAQPLDLNTASIKELEQLPGIGPTTAKAIFDFRVKGGRFRRVSDLLVIRGISESKLARIRPYVTVVVPSTKNPPASTPSSSAPPATTHRSP
jgi:competence ComEA-like helix-hairpin-helix protein